MSKIRSVVHVCCVLSFFGIAKANAETQTASIPVTTSTIVGAPVQAKAQAQIDFGEEGDIILKVYLRDMLLTDGLLAYMRNGRVYLPLAELSSILDFPIVVDAVTGKASGWYLKPENTFSLDIRTGSVMVGRASHNFVSSEVFSDELDVFVDSVLLQKWLPLFLDTSLAAQILTIRSSEKLPKELARERSKRKVGSDVVYNAKKEFDVPGYRLLDWPEVSLGLGSFYSPEANMSNYDYRVRAVGDFAFLNGKIGFSGSQHNITGATVTLGRSNPRGMFGPLRVGDFEIGDTSQFLPGLIGSSLSGRGLRASSAPLANRRDLDVIDLQGEQQADYEIEVYVNDRLRGVDRDSSDNTYDFQDIPLQLGQNEIRLEFYGPQGQRYTESRRTFVGGGSGRKGELNYEFALVEPGLRTFDIVDEFSEAREGGGVPEIKLSSALNLSYGLTQHTGLALTLASIATEDAQDATSSSENSLYGSARLSTQAAGVLMSGDVTVDPNGKLAGSLGARTSLGNYELGFSQQVFQKDYRDTGSINREDSDSLTRLATSASVSRQFFRVPGGRVSYETNTAYRQNHLGDATASLGARADYQTRYIGLSWSHSLQHNLASDNGRSTGQIGARFGASSLTRWSLSSDVSYSDTGEEKIDGGSLRLSRPLNGSGYLSLSASRDLQASTDTAYSASWSRQFQPFRLNTAVTGTSSKDISLRVGVDLTVRRYPKRWLPAISSSGGRGTVAVMVFGDDNQNGKHDKFEPILEGVRITRNGLLAGVETDSNGVALLTGLSNNTSVDIGILETDIKDPSLKFKGIEKGILSRPGRVPLVAVALQRATDIEGTVTVAKTTPAPNVRMLLTPVGGGESMEIHTEYDGYYYLSHVPLGRYDFGPDPEQLESAGLVAQPPTRRLVLESLDDFPPPEDFDLVRLADLDPDDDDDGVPDVADAFPLDPTESVDTDDDGIGNNADTDDDGDDVADKEDAFPLDASESLDTDGDGIGNNADTDDDGDGRSDHLDHFPLDSTERADSDSDGIGNNKDNDDDGDGVEDRLDAFPLNAQEAVDSDLDGVGDNADKDDDNDQVVDALDQCPATHVPEVSVPAKSISKGRYVISELDNDGRFQSTNRTVYTLAQTAGCSCEQILSSRPKFAKRTSHPRIAAALRGIDQSELKHGCRKSTLRAWVKKVQRTR